MLVDRAGPPPPTACAVGSPVFGGWYKGSAEVTFSANGAGTLPDESEGAALEGSSLTANQTISGSGTHTVCGTIENVLGEKSNEGCTTVKVDATAPTVTLTCPATAELDACGVKATTPPQTASPASRAALQAVRDTDRQPWRADRKPDRHRQRRQPDHG